MNTLKFERTIFKFDIYGEEVQVRAPRVHEYKKFIKDMSKENRKKADFDLMCEFLTGLGMKKELIDELESNHLMQIIDAITKGEIEKK